MERIVKCMERLGTKDAPPLECLEGVVVTLITYTFIFLGAVCLLFLMYGAIRFILSGGDPKAVKSARDTMTYAVIGTIIVVLVFVIANTFTTLFGIPTRTLFDFKIGP